MDNKQHDTKQTTGSTPRATSQVGTHGQTSSKDGGQGSQNKGQGQDRGQGQPMSSGQNDWNDRAQREMQQGDETRPATPSGTSPLDRDQQPVNQNRPVQQNR
jgi:hypothetical protein